jgi:hypothetical protein
MDVLERVIGFSQEMEGLQDDEAGDDCVCCGYSWDDIPGHLYELRDNEIWGS